MSDTDNTKPQDQAPTEPVSVPSQSSPHDTSNWDDRPFTTPSDRIVIENLEGSDENPIVNK